MLKIEQFEGELYSIKFESADGNVKFSGVFKLVEDATDEDFVPLENGLKVIIE